MRTCPKHDRPVVLALFGLIHASPFGVTLAADGPCTGAQLTAVATAADPTLMVIGMMGSAPECANCFMGCASKTDAEKTACGKACGPAAMSDASPPGPPPTDAPPTAPAPPETKKCEDSADDVVNAASGGLLPSCAAGKALCAADPRIPVGCPLSCGVCKPEKKECKDSPDDVVNAASGARPSTGLRSKPTASAVCSLHVPKCHSMASVALLTAHPCCIPSAAGGLLPNCAAGKALCAADPRIPAGCPLTCGVCKAECKDSPDEVVNAASGTHPPRHESVTVDVSDPMDGVQVACSPTVQPARHCAAQIHASRPAARSRAGCARTETRRRSWSQCCANRGRWRAIDYASLAAATDTHRHDHTNCAGHCTPCCRCARTWMRSCSRATASARATETARLPSTRSTWDAHVPTCL